jgi:uncharacterized protein (TIGR02001 family)
MERLRISALTALVGAVVVASPVRAKDGETDPPPVVDVTATVSVVSDYHFRGFSLTDRDPALQGSIDVSHTPTGLYAGAWGSTISRYGGAKTEIDLYAGWETSLGPIDLDVGGQFYLFPNGSGVNYAEFYSYLGHTIGPAELRAGVIYAPSQDNLGNTDNLYLTSDARVGIPETPVTITASVGYENGAFEGPSGSKLDWSLGAEATKGIFTLGISYVDTDIPRLADPTRTSKAGVVVSLTAEF